jgi:acylphosphatase
MKKAILTVIGRVQGVFFRSFVKEKADELGLVGRVKNEISGRVKILAEGEEENLKKLILYCQSGPEFAKVDRVDVKWEEAEGVFKKFAIK